jgi:predicted metal-dependent hydrolase
MTDWLDKAKEKAQEAAAAAKNAGSSLKSAAEQLTQNVKSSTSKVAENIESAVHHDTDVASLLAKVEDLLKANLDKANEAIKLLEEIKKDFPKQE